MNKNLLNLKENNPSVEIITETDHVNIKNLWKDETFMCRFKNNVHLDALSDVKFPYELSGIFHTKLNVLELIYTPLKNDDSVLERKFTFYYGGGEFQCYYAEPTETLKLIANGFRETSPSSDTDYRNLRKFRDYYKMAELPNYIQKYFEHRKPINFFIKGDFKKINNDLVLLAKHINFYMRFYDRTTPTLMIFEPDVDDIKFNIPCHNLKEGFPKVLNIDSQDPVLLDLFQIARNTSNARLKFIFYFQVLEYCSYYYLNDELKKRLTKIVKRPDLLNNSNVYSQLLIDEFKDYFKHNDDSLKLEKVITENCDWNDIKMEIECHRDYFSKPLEFDGGYKINALISEKEDLDSPNPTIIRNVKINIEKIRNVLVHLRENRENKVILPTNRNNKLLIPYLHLIYRIAEIVSMQHKN